MKKVLFVSLRGIEKRTKFCKEYFDELNKMSAMWMMKVHGCGRWPSSRVAKAVCETRDAMTPEECEWADYIILMDNKTPDWRDKGMYSRKIEHWHIDENLPWNEQEEIIKGLVRALVEKCETGPYLGKK